MKAPGIFNDAIGPVMRGPSSSHTAGSHRIGNLIRQFAGNEIRRVVFSFHPEGSLATTYHTQGSDIGLAAGLLGIGMTDARVIDSLSLAEESGLDIGFVISDYPADHPNTYKCFIETKESGSFSLTALSTGGGLIELIEYQGFEFRLSMDLPTLFIAEGMSKEELRHSLQTLNSGFILSHEKAVFNNQALHILEVRQDSATINEILTRYPDTATLINPVYPVLGYAGTPLPFCRSIELERQPELMEKRLSELAIKYETLRSSLTRDQVLDKMAELVDVLQAAVDTGLNGTHYHDRILGAQSPGFLANKNNGVLLPDGPLSRMTAYTMAIMESKSAMEVIVAAPTAGSAGGLPGALLGLAEEMECGKEALVHAFLAAGLIGVFFSADATFAAEVAGCQAETGVGAAMAAAGMIELAGGNAQQAMGAASIAIQNIMGLVCDPVANRVEVPCLSRNVQAGANALTSANLILGGADPVIPLSESIETMMRVGKMMHRELRCTALGGLAVTPSAKRIEAKLLLNQERRTKNKELD